MNEESEFQRYRFILAELKGRVERLAGRVAALSGTERACERCGRSYHAQASDRHCPDCRGK